MVIVHGDFGGRQEQLKKSEKKKKPVPLYQLHVSLVFSDPLIWRRILVPGKINLRQLHEVLQLCMGWSGKYTHQFYVGKIFYDMNTMKKDGRYHEADYNLHTLEDNMKRCFIYLYDAGDGWEHEIALEEVRVPQPQDDTFPVVLDGEWAAPPEDIGGVHGYAQVLPALENLEDKGNRRIVKEQDLDNFDPFFFDCGIINTKLKEQVWAK